MQKSKAMELDMIQVIPCCFTDEEKIERINRSLQDADAGLGVLHKEMFKRHREWT